ncbi:outer membrane beta-barrel protein [Buchnera aphidicola]|uniref:Outer membrane protein A n=1 Tax=Buchnera aphidicola subsp. Cinara cedri (strain Cc) TaxID=372461 RepID=Q057M0_BUCCC|nr:outer membrane beta-barrel protein [Buchnera aphidicola]ABJ90679.1 outer membrane protein A precursor [Buchnera aphidicola BCc]
MKKFFIVSTLLLSSIFSVAHAESNTVKKKWNFGIQFNSLNPLKSFYNYKILCLKNYKNITKKIISLNPGFFTKYQKNPYLNFELKLNLLENKIKDIKKNTLNAYFSNVEYATNIMYPLKKYLNIYTKIGAKIKANIHNTCLKDIFMIKKYKKFSPLFSIGLELLINKYLHSNIDINLNKHFHKLQLNKISTFTDNVNIGFSWKFNPVKDKIINLFKKSNNKLFLENYESFNKYKNIKDKIFFHPKIFKLSSTSNDFLNVLINKISKIKKDKIYLIITGNMNNQLKKTKKNKIMSFKRALEISKFFVNNGILKKNIIIQGINNIDLKNNIILNKFFTGKNLLNDPYFENQKVNIELKINSK